MLMLLLNEVGSVNIFSICRVFTLKVEEGTFVHIPVVYPGCKRKLYFQEITGRV